ncbi:MAG: hypothetical protein NUV54_00335 [Candidatus Taylorbacteria bacterium]|nr:hypothetical protein [Candidatus Taylorbacteria bacterium]
MLIYTGTAFGWFYVMKHMKLSSLGIVYALTVSILVVLVGVLYFHEKLNTPEIIGMIMAVISLILLSRFA